MVLSLCMIVKDEEKLLPRCLKSTEGLVDEYVIVDTGSSDGTREIAARYDKKARSFPWTDDFSAARNYSFSEARGDFLFWLDADDVLPDEAGSSFQKLREFLTEGDYDMVYCPYRSGGFVYRRERFLKRRPEIKWRGYVHECIPPFGKQASFGFPVLHLPEKEDKGMRNLMIYQKQAKKGAMSGRDLFYYGRELSYHGLDIEAIAVLRKMLEGDGWYVNKIEACRVLAGCLARTGDRAGALLALFGSFRFGEPRAAVLCEIGKHFTEDGRYREAVYWYEQALRARDHTEEGDFECPDCRTVIPTLELVRLYHVLGEYSKSLEYHKKSEALAPDHPSVRFNRAYFGC